ncbi:MAG: hypothetical protein Q9226_006060 [Calogaya cf. arnoldii]
MAQYDGVTVKVVSDGKSCPMYDDPDADGHENPFSETSPPQKYIEAVTGAKFAVVLTLGPNFRFKKCDGVRVTYHLDGDEQEWQNTISSKDAIRGPFENRTLTFNCIRKYCHRTGQWQHGDLAFGELKIHERTDPVTSVNDVKGLGQIQIRWQRVHFGKETVHEYNKNGTEPVSEVSEKVLKGKAIDTAIKFALPALNVFSTLQMLGCIPPSPSPALLNTPSGAAGVKPDDSKEELRRLRARVAELEDRTGNTPQPKIKPEQLNSASRIKREREDKENDGQRKKSRRSGPPEVVDLTAD